MSSNIERSEDDEVEIGDMRLKLKTFTDNN